MVPKNPAGDMDLGWSGRRAGREVAAVFPRIPEPGFVVPQTGNC